MAATSLGFVRNNPWVQRDRRQQQNPQNHSNCPTTIPSASAGSHLPGHQQQIDLKEELPKSASKPAYQNNPQHQNRLRNSTISTPKQSTVLLPTTNPNNLLLDEYYGSNNNIAVDQQNPTTTNQVPHYYDHGSHRIHRNEKTTNNQSSLLISSNPSTTTTTTTTHHSPKNTHSQSIKNDNHTRTSAPSSVARVTNITITQQEEKNVPNAPPSFPPPNSVEQNHRQFLVSTSTTGEQRGQKSFDLNHQDPQQQQQQQQQQLHNLPPLGHSNMKSVTHQQQQQHEHRSLTGSAAQQTAYSKGYYELTSAAGGGIDDYPEDDLTATEVDDEVEYGPGIVRKLRDKFLWLAAEVAEKADGRRWHSGGNNHRHSIARKAQSLESLLDGPPVQSSAASNSPSNAAGLSPFIAESDRRLIVENEGSFGSHNTFRAAMLHHEQNKTAPPTMFCYDTASRYQERYQKDDRFDRRQHQPANYPAPSSSSNAERTPAPRIPSNLLQSQYHQSPPYNTRKTSSSAVHQMKYKLYGSHGNLLSCGNSDDNHSSSSLQNGRAAALQQYSNVGGGVRRKKEMAPESATVDEMVPEVPKPLARQQQQQQSEHQIQDHAHPKPIQNQKLLLNRNGRGSSSAASSFSDMDELGEGNILKLPKLKKSKTQKITAIQAADEEEDGKDEPEFVRAQRKLRPVPLGQTSATDLIIKKQSSPAQSPPADPSTSNQSSRDAMKSSAHKHQSYLTITAANNQQYESAANPAAAMDEKFSTSFSRPPGVVPTNGNGSIVGRSSQISEGSCCEGRSTLSESSSLTPALSSPSGSSELTPPPEEPIPPPTTRTLPPQSEQSSSSSATRINPPDYQQHRMLRFGDQDDEVRSDEKDHHYKTSPVEKRQLEEQQQNPAAGDIIIEESLRYIKDGNDDLIVVERPLPPPLKLDRNLRIIGISSTVPAAPANNENDNERKSSGIITIGSINSGSREEYERLTPSSSDISVPSSSSLSSKSSLSAASATSNNVVSLSSHASSPKSSSISPSNSSSSSSNQRLTRRRWDVRMDHDEDESATGSMSYEVLSKASILDPPDPLKPKLVMGNDDGLIGSTPTVQKPGILGSGDDGLDRSSRNSGNSSSPSQTASHNPQMINPAATTLAFSQNLKMTNPAATALAPSQNLQMDNPAISSVNSDVLNAAMTHPNMEGILNQMAETIAENIKSQQQQQQQQQSQISSPETNPQSPEAADLLNTGNTLAVTDDQIDDGAAAVGSEGEERQQHHHHHQEEEEEESPAFVGSKTVSFNALDDADFFGAAQPMKPPNATPEYNGLSDENLLKENESKSMKEDHEIDPATTEYGVRPLVSLIPEEDLDEFLSAAADEDFKFELEGGHGQIPPTGSILIKEKKRSKGRVGFSSEPIKAYAYQKANQIDSDGDQEGDESGQNVELSGLTSGDFDNDDRSSTKWNGGVEITDLEYIELCSQLAGSFSLEPSDYFSSPHRLICILEKVSIFRGEKEEMLKERLLELELATRIHQQQQESFQSNLPSIPKGASLVNYIPKELNGGSDSGSSTKSDHLSASHHQSERSFADNQSTNSVSISHQLDGDSFSKTESASSDLLF